MKQRISALRTSCFLLVVVFALFTACSGGSFYDPGQNVSGLPGGTAGDGGGGGGNGGNYDGSSKPAKLSSSASYSQAVAKINQIITYCNAHPGNDDAKEKAQTFTDEVSQSTYESNRQNYVEAINSLIDDLE
jgi:hypothetical protein